MGYVDHPPQRAQGAVLLACPPIIECGFDSSLPSDDTVYGDVQDLPRSFQRGTKSEAR
jgi:hypothetical protein